MNFVKYSSSGNDFLICQSTHRDNGLRADIAKRVCERHNGIGADGMVIVIPIKGQIYAYEWEFYNADGSLAKMCGNASRSVGHYAYIEGLAPKKHSFLSQAGIIGIEIDKCDSSLVQSDLGIAKILQENIIESNPYNVAYWTLIDTGVPHLVGFGADKATLPKEKDVLLAKLRHQYNANISIGFYENDKISYMSYERGVEDITMACGTGAAAVFTAALEQHLCDKSAALIPPSGDVLTLQKNENAHILFKGSVSRIARCEWLLDTILM